MKNAQWAVLPLIWSDERAYKSDMGPYVLTGSMGYSGLNTANVAKRELNARGIACHVYLIEGE